MTTKELVRNFLQQEGYKFEETTNLFRFKAQGLNYVCDADERDPIFFRIMVPVIFSANDRPEISREQVLQACNNIVEQIKVLKAYMDSDGDVSLTIEQFVSEDTQDLTNVLERSINLLAEGRIIFAKELNNIQL